MKLFNTAILFCSFFFLASCNPQTRAIPSVVHQKSATFTATASPTKSSTATASQTQQAAFTSTKTQPPSATPTFDVRTIVTRTPAPRAECPAVQADKVADFEYDQLQAYLLDFLNAGGPPQAIIKLYQQHNSKQIDRRAQIVDLTGDSLPYI